MTTYRYSFNKYDAEKMAKAVGADLPISTKQSIEICSFIKGKSLLKAKELLEGAVKMKVPVPFRRFTEGAGHKKGKIASGRYPVKASSEILKLINSLEANAQQKGLDTSSLVISHACANKASRTPRYGRIRGRLTKRSHVELIATESGSKQEAKPETKKEEKKKKEAKPEAEKETKKEEKPVEKKEEPKKGQKPETKKEEKKEDKKQDNKEKPKVKE